MPSRRHRMKNNVIWHRCEIIALALSLSRAMTQTQNRIDAGEVMDFTEPAAPLPLPASELKEPRPVHDQAKFLASLRAKFNFVAIPADCNCTFTCLAHELITPHAKSSPKLSIAVGSYPCHCCFAISRDVGLANADGIRSQSKCFNDAQPNHHGHTTNHAFVHGIR